MTQPKTAVLEISSQIPDFRLQGSARSGLSRGMKHQLTSPAQAAEVLGVSVDTVRHMIHRRDIPFVQVGGQYRISEAALDRWIEARTVEPVLISDLMRSERVAQRSWRRSTGAETAVASSGRSGGVARAGSIRSAAATRRLRIRGTPGLLPRRRNAGILSPTALPPMSLWGLCSTSGGRLMSKGGRATRVLFVRGSSRTTFPQIGSPTRPATSALGSCRPLPVSLPELWAFHGCQSPVGAEAGTYVVPLPHAFRTLPVSYTAPQCRSQRLANRLKSGPAGVITCRDDKARGGLVRPSR